MIKLAFIKFLKEECTILYKTLNIILEKNKDIIKENPNELGCILAEEFMSNIC